MYRVLIVDDEPYIADWIYSIVESLKEYELDIYRVYSSYEALEFFNRAKIDILVSDICMPDMSGIDLLEKVRENWAACKVIMLTGHSNFDYAYESIRNKAFGYIMKNEKDEKILDTIKQAIDQTEKELKSSKVIVDAKKMINEIMTYAREELLLSLLNGDFYNMRVLCDKYKKFDMQFDADEPYILLVGKIKSLRSEADITDEHRCIASIKHVLAEHFKEKFMVQCAQYASMKMCCVLQPLENTYKNNRKELQSAFITGTLETVQKICNSTLDVEASFVYTNAYVTIDRLPDKFDIMDDIISNIHIKESGFILNDKSIAENGSSCPEQESCRFTKLSGNEKFFVKLQFLIETGQRELYLRHMDTVREELQKSQSRYDNEALEIYFRVALILLIHINKRKTISKEAFKIGLNRLMTIDSHENWSIAFEYLQEFSEMLFDMNDCSNGNITLVQFVQKYIQENITEDVSLIKLSEVTGYNPSYISRTYKEASGQTLSDYISIMRLNKVKEYMTQNNTSLNDIVLSVGFQSRQYFNRFIKKMTNMTPSEFKHHLISNPAQQDNRV